MRDLTTYAESFKFKYEKFLCGCDSVEEMELWDKDTYGEMDAFYSADLVSVILRLIVADGAISQTEVAYINDIFGFTYTVEELQTIYEDCGEGIEHIYDEGVASGYALMKGINDKLAAAYKELLTLICDIVMASDGVLATSELDMAHKLKALGE